jgi:hypothetical protein
MASLIIPEPPIFSHGWMSWFDCENNYFTERAACETAGLPDILEK